MTPMRAHESCVGPSHGTTPWRLGRDRSMSARVQRHAEHARSGGGWHERQGRREQYDQSRDRRKAAATAGLVMTFHFRGGEAEAAAQDPEPLPERQPPRTVQQRRLRPAEYQARGGPGGNGGNDGGAGGPAAVANPDWIATDAGNATATATATNGGTTTATARGGGIVPDAANAAKRAAGGQGGFGAMFGGPGNAGASGGTAMATATTTGNGSSIATATGGSAGRGGKGGNAIGLGAKEGGPRWAGRGWWRRGCER